MRTNRESLLLAVALAASVVAAGCTHIGPETVVVDRFDYSTAIAESWKQQTLLNIVKLRYMDLPVFVDVASIVSGYSLQTGVSIGGTVSSQNTADFATVGGQAIYIDRPTITYVPLTGERFLRGLITPIDPKHIFSLLQSGYAADFILALTVESLNGVRNRSATSVAVREADPEFIRVLELMRDVQGAGGVGLRMEEGTADDEAAVLFFRRDDLPPDILEKSREIRRLLRMAPDQQKFVLTYSPVRGADNELAVNSRSMMQIMHAFASNVDMPDADMEDNRSPTASRARGHGRGPGERAHLQRQGKTRDCVRGHTVPPALVLDRRRRLADEARFRRDPVLLHAGGHRRQRAAAHGHHPGAVDRRRQPGDSADGRKQDSSNGQRQAPDGMA